MKAFTVMPLFTDHVDEIVDDIIERYESGVATEKEPLGIKELTADGTFAHVDFELADGTVRVLTKVEILHPVILLIE